MTASQENPLRDRPTGELLKELSDQSTTLIKQEVELAKAELQAKGKQAGVGAGMFGGAGVFGIGAFAALTTAVIAVLATATDTWLAALIVAVVYGAVAGALAMQGKSKVQEAVPPVPEEAMDSVKEDVEWAKTRARSGRT
ncbi:MAG: phage holin family protein [Thermoleophilaceae bacterium]|nr:phage holin family protein [Thermoleophilaceae bacterium]